MFNIEFALFLALEGQILLSINCFRDEKHCWLNENENTSGEVCGNWLQKNWILDMALPLTHSLTLRKPFKIIILITNIEYTHVPDTMNFLIYEMRA